MTKITARGCREIGRAVHRDSGSGILFRSDGEILTHGGDSWSPWRRLKPGLDPAETCRRWMEASDSRWMEGKTPPSTRKLAKWLSEGGGCQAADGCWVEPDSTCEHGYHSWLLVRGMI